MLTREQILAADDRHYEVVEVPEWGGSVRVATMTGAQRDAFEASLLSGGAPDLTNARAKLVAYCCVDDSGNPLFTAADVEALGRKSAAALNRVAEVARRLNLLGEEGVEAAKGN